MKFQHTLATLVFLFLAATAAVAGPVAEVSIDASGVYFQTRLSGGYELKVSGPAGYSMSRTFTDSAPSFNVADTDGVDGTYTYELVHLPVIAENADRAAVALRQPLVQSGAFTLAGGSLVNPDLQEQGYDKAQVFTTDLITQGSACIGFDCTSSESFGFDTLRLKENNLRIHFDDTSSSASFPGNDWRLIANDSSNGGANYFAIEDATGGKTPFKVEAGAKTNALYVEDDGDVGVGTASPAVRMHLVKGDSPTLRLEQDGSSGFTPQSWDVAGNETNFFVRDVTNGSKLPFRIRPGAPDSAIDIAASGNVGIGTDSASQSLHVKRSDGSAQLLVEEASSTTAARGLVALKNNGGAYMSFENTSTGQTWFFNHENSSPNRFIINSSVNAGAELALTNSGVLSVASACIELGAYACTASAGAFSCVAGTCP